MSDSPVRLADISLRALGRLESPSAVTWAALAPALTALDQAGFTSIDAWGGLTIGRCLRVLNETPWQRLRLLKEHIRQTPLQVEVRGRCLFGSRPSPPEVIEDFVAEVASCGVDSFLIYEPLNDPTGLRMVAEAVRQAGCRAVLGIVFSDGAEEEVLACTTVLEQVATLQPAAVCLKIVGDVAPGISAGLVERAAHVTGSPVEIRLENGDGASARVAAACIEAGASVIYASSAPRWVDPAAWRSESLVRSLQDIGRAVDVDHDAVAAAEILMGRSLFDGCASNSPLAISCEISLVDPRDRARIPFDVLEQVVGRLRSSDSARRLPDVVAEMLRIKGELGDPPLVAPLAQLIATQALLNVVYAPRWQVVPDEMKLYLKGAYGSPPLSPDIELAQSILGSAVLEGRDQGDSDATGGPGGADPAREPTLGADRADRLLQVLAPASAPAFFERRAAAKDVEAMFDLAEGPGARDASAVAQGAQGRLGGLDSERIRELVGLLEHSAIEELTLEDQGTKMSLRKAGAPGVGVPPEVPPRETPSGASGEMSAAPVDDGHITITASMLGTFYRSPAPGSPPFVDVGSQVQPGDPLCVLEAMKLLNEQQAEVAGEITAVLVDDGAAVEYGQPLFIMRPYED